ncbi:hypothetical protein GHK92_08430 [Nocardioides sp. dk4132]|uniref:hypothetical protein n=1 Tax=unclassified Nocardioides TaxID=2615069 RepID=UPI00129654FA|nr:MULTISPECIES: hypothetical protein [unclassified Nocardioides]MQW75897.1 hypothetical protein [Nocardioides sp. dk4132]QGA08760.1 hypothetical protein GFH29_16190 [Nocardioides sp. dk884]
MSGRRRLRPATAGLALVVSLGAGLLAGAVPGHHPTPEPDPYDQAVLAAAAASTPGDRVQAAIDAVQETGLHIGPELRGELGADEVDRIEEIIADAPVPLFVVWWEESWQAGYYPPESAMDQLRAGVFREGFYAVVSPGRPPYLAALGYQEPRIEADGTGRPAAALTRVVTELADTEAARPGEPRPGSDDWGGAGGGLAAGLLFALLGYLGLLLVFGVLGAMASSRSPRTLEARP